MQNFLSLPAQVLAGLADAIQDRFGERPELIPSGGGVFEVEVDGTRVRTGLLREPEGARVALGLFLGALAGIVVGLLFRWPAGRVIVRVAGVVVVLVGGYYLVPHL